MFLDVLRRRNPAFLQAVITLHRAGRLPANAYALDLDAVRDNARALREAGDRHGLEVLAMTKQVGRAPGFLAAVREGGIEAGVAVDMTDARALAAGGLRVGHVGHLVQVPRAEAAAAAALQPGNWTVFSDDKAVEAATASRDLGREQDLLARIHAPGDRFYPGHEGGFAAADVVQVAERMDALEGARFAGVTTFPALLFDAASATVKPTPNAQTLARAVAALRAAGRDEVRVNAPGTTSVEVFPLLAQLGATQVEPGHGLTGTTPPHALRDLPERPAACYVTEVSHHHGDRAFVFGGGLYIDPVFGDYRLRALVARDEALEDAHLLDATIPPPEAIDYYGQLDPGDRPLPPTGATAVFGFRIQAFVTRAYVAGIAGVADGTPRVAGIWTSDGREAAWPQ
ncbi:MAG: putative amino acid racemase [Solirubrobacterales bacterium]|jgi:predicted amino acid racemase|nr:putative amino acid racemase [Solirubrobacterales bacterium]